VLPVMIMNSLEGKIGVVTGSTRGIGRAIVESFLKEGMRVVVTARNTREVEDVTQKLGAQYPGKVAGIPCDVRIYEQVRNLMDFTEKTFGGLDVLVNNAGVGGFGYVEELSIEQWNECIGTNLTGVFHCCKEAIPRMKKRGGGYIINISSLAGKNPFAGGAAYNASKFGLNGFSEALMQEVRYDNIKVSYIAPGSVNTSFGRSGTPGGKSEWALFPEDIARVVVDLLHHHPRSLPSYVEIRPSKPPKK
ncbi:MAG: SDR family oxidoreductase, partial [bacterium]